MIIIAAVDDNMGLMFNHRRLSQDHLLRKNILEMTEGHRLWMNQYSYKQFCQGDDGPQINVDDSFMHEAVQGDFAFIEDTSVKVVVDKCTSSSSLANNIMRLVQAEFDKKMYISVQFSS